MGLRAVRTRDDPVDDLTLSRSACRRRGNRECINCAVCFAACDTVRWNDDYLGPAALNRAWTLVNDVRDAGQSERLKSIVGRRGCQSCHSHQSCAELCPSRSTHGLIAGLTCHDGVLRGAVMVLDAGAVAGSWALCRSSVGTPC